MRDQTSGGEVQWNIVTHLALGRQPENFGIHLVVVPVGEWTIDAGDVRRRVGG
jgi:hypothetical protein